MSKIVAYATMIIAASVSATVAAQEGGVRLKCQGEYSDYSDTKIRDVPFSLSVEVGADSVKVLGSPGLDAVYQIHLRREDGVGFRFAANPLFSGFVNRYTGKISLLEKMSNSDRYAKLFSGECQTVRALF